MFTTQYHAVPSQTKAANPTLLLVTALLLGLVTSTLFAASGDKPVRPPGLLPVGADEVATPMGNDGVESFVANAWQAIENQNAGRWEEAIATWQATSAPCNLEVWRQVSMGVAHLYVDRHDLAAEHFSLALELDKENAAVHYFAGLMLLEKAAVASEFHDAILLTDTRLVDYVPDRPSPSLDSGKAKSRLEREAINKLETAITYASEIDIYATLADVQWVVPVPYPVSQPPVSPTVGQLLSSLGADNFSGKAHGLLASLYLDHGDPGQAEYHIDQAISLGIAVPYAYRTAGELYEEQGKSTDAFRAYLKAMKQGEGVVTPGTRALRSLGSAFEELF